MSLKPLILVTNDDGITAPGIRSLVKIMNSIGEVVIVAPDSPKSAMGHAITVNSTLHCSRTKIDSGPQKEGIHSEFPRPVWQRAAEPEEAEEEHQRIGEGVKRKSLSLSR